MKCIIKILFLIILSMQFALAKEVNFIHITDINLNSANAPYLKNTIKEINGFKDIDFVVFGGNNIQKPNFENLNTFLYLLKKINKKSYVLLGSNDVLSSSGINKDFYLKKVRRALKFRHSKTPNYTFSKKGYLFIVMDGSKQYFKSSNGYYTKAELLWLDKTLQKNTKKNVIILQHFPLLETSSKWQETAKTEDYFELLNKYKNVKIIVSGHYGTNSETEKDGIMHIITESYSKNHAFKVIKVNLDDDFIATYLIK